MQNVEKSKNAELYKFLFYSSQLLSGPSLLFAFCFLPFAFFGLAKRGKIAATGTHTTPCARFCFLLFLFVFSFCFLLSAFCFLFVFSFCFLLFVFCFLTFAFFGLAKRGKIAATGSHPTPCARFCFLLFLFVFSFYYTNRHLGTVLNSALFCIIISPKGQRQKQKQICIQHYAFAFLFLYVR